MLIYCADYVVQLDTGSSDLWIKGDTYPLPNSDISVRVVTSSTAS